MKNILLCPWVERWIPSEVWNSIKSDVEFVKAIDKDNGLTEYQLLDKENKIIYSFED